MCIHKRKESKKRYQETKLVKKFGKYNIRFAVVSVVWTFSISNVLLFWK